MKFEENEVRVEAYERNMCASSESSFIARSASSSIQFVTFFILNVIQQ